MLIKFKMSDSDYTALDRFDFFKSVLLDSDKNLLFDDVGIKLYFGAPYAYNEFALEMTGLKDFDRKDDLYKVVINRLLDMAKEERVKKVEIEKKREKERAKKAEEKRALEQSILDKIAGKFSKKEEEPKKVKTKYRIKATDGKRVLDREFDDISDLDDTLSKFFRSRSYSDASDSKDKFQELLQGVNPIDNLTDEFDRVFGKPNCRKKGWWE